MKRILILVFAFLLLGFSIVLAQKGNKVVTITCPGGGNPVIDPDPVTIFCGEKVTFGVVTAGANGCVSGVNVNGSAPIGNFNLTPADPQEEITFPNAGTYNYTVTKLKGEIIASGQVIVKQGQYCTPTLTQWGIIILIALLVGSGAFIILRRKKATMAV
jgi:plastocyanin